MAFDTLVAADRLIKVGVSTEQAGEMVRVMAECVREGAATKSDLQEVKTELKLEIQAVKSELGQRIDNLAGKVDGLNDKITIRIAGVLAAFLVAYSGALWVFASHVFVMK